MNRSQRLALALGCIIACSLILPRAYLRRDASRHFEAEFEIQEKWGRRVAEELLRRPERQLFQTQSRRFNSQSSIAIYQMAILGLGQIVQAHPELREEFLPAMRSAAERMVDARTLNYARDVYEEDAIVDLHFEGHAYLGYVNLALGMMRQIDPDTPHAELHDRLSDELARNLDASPLGMLETYPGETWPPDVAAVAGSVGFHSKVTGQDRSALLARWQERFRSCALHASGYLIQRLETGSCTPRDLPRGSGTAVSSYFLSFYENELSRELEQSLAAMGHREFLGLGALREYPPGQSGLGDGNSGPVIFGVSIGATGFGLGAARAHGDATLFESLFATTALFGLPVESESSLDFAAGGLLGNSLLLAMLSAGGES